jgi:sarcosine oxidase
MSKSYDVIVVGVGAVGSATCYDLTKRGLRVLGLEQFSIPHNLGGSHGHSRQTKIAPYIGSEYEPVILRAYELYRELVEESGQQDIMVKTGFLDLAPHRNFPAYKLPHNRRFEDLSIAQVNARYPQFQLDEPYWGAYDPEGALLRPEAAITTYVRLAMQRGAHILGNTKVLDWSTDAGGVTVKTDRETYTADRIVFCAGPWTGKLLKELCIAVTVTRMSFAWVWPLKNVRAYECGTMPCWCLEDENGIYYGFPMMSDVPGYKIGLHWYGEMVDPDNFNRTPNAHDEELIRKGLRRYFPEANGPLTGLRTCLYDHTVDDVPIMDKHPELDRVTLCGPLCGAGFKFVPAYAEIAADFVEKGRTDLKSDFLRIDRLLKRPQVA